MRVGTVHPTSRPSSTTPPPCSETALVCESRGYEEFRHTLRPDVLVHLRRLCDQSTTIGDLEQQISNITGVSTREFRSHLLWLLKHNELSIEIESVGEQVEGLTQALAREQECNDPVEFEELPATGVL
jgi:hypothetical protein